MVCQFRKEDILHHPKHRVLFEFDVLNLELKDMHFELDTCVKIVFL